MDSSHFTKPSEKTNTEMAPEEDEQQQQQKQNDGVSTGKLEALSGNFNLILIPPPRKLLDMAAHESLLTRLGLWDFVNLDFDRSIRTDLIKELVASYKYYPKKYTGESRVHGVSISLNRNAVANALRLPVERVVKGGSFPVSKEEGSFLEELIWGFLVLRDDREDASVMSQRYVVSREMRVERSDWAGLVWFMVERELLRGQNLVNCHYASHLQLLLKHQRPELFDDDDHHHGSEVVGSTDGIAGAGAGEVHIGPNESILTTSCKRQREFLDEDVVGERLRKMHCADLAGRELGGDDQVTEGGNMDGVCLSDTIDTPENGRKVLLNLQADLNEKIHSSDRDISVAEPGDCESHTYNPLKISIEMAEHKGHHVEERENEGVVDLETEGLMINSEKEDDVMQNVANEAVCDTSTDNAPKVHCMEEDYVVQDEADERVCATSSGNAPKVHCMEEDYVVQDKANGGVCATSTDNALKVHCMKEEDYVVQDEADEQMCATSTDSALKVYCLKEDYVVQDEADEGVCATSTDNAPKVHCMKEDYVGQDEADEKVCATSTDNAPKGHCMKENYVVQNEAGEGECATSTDYALKVHCLKEDYVVLKEGSEAAFEANACKLLELHSRNEGNVMGDEAKASREASILISHDVHSERDDSVHEEEANEAELEANIGKSADVHCEKKDHEMKDEENESAFEANVGNSLDVRCVKEHVMEEKENNANISDSLKEEVNTAQDHQQPEFKYAAEKNRDSLVDFSIVEMECQEVDMNCMADHTGIDVESVASVGFLVTREAHDEGVKKEGSSDGLNSQETENQQKEVNIIENQHQSELELINATEMNGDDVAGNEMDCQEVDLNCMADNTGREVESVTSVDLLVTHEAHDEVVKKDSSTDGLENQKIENQYKPELEFKSATEMNRDSIADAAVDGMDCQVVDLNCVANNAGREVESRTSVDLVVAQEAHDDVVKNEGSADGLDTQKVENQPVYLGSCQENNGSKFILEISEEDKRRIPHKKVNIEGENLDLEMDHGGTELVLIQIDKEDDEMGTLVNQACEVKLDDLQGNEERKMHKVQNDICSEKYDAKCHNAFEHLERGEGNIDLPLQASGTNQTVMNPLLVASDEVPGKGETVHAPETKDIGGEVEKHEEIFLPDGLVLQQCTTIDHSFLVPLSNASVEKAPSIQGNAVGNASITHTSLGLFASETDMGMNIHCGHAAETSNLIGVSDERCEELDLDLCTEQIEVWMERLKNSARRKVEENHISNVVLQKKIEEQNQLIHQYEFMLQKERQQKQASDRRYNGELHLMHSVLQDYRKALKEVDKSFTKYRERIQLPEESLYMPHPDGGGNVILVSEWKKLEEECRKKCLSDVKAMVENFEEEWRSDLEEQLGILDMYCNKLEGLEHNVRTLSGRL